MSEVGLMGGMRSRRVIAAAGSGLLFLAGCGPTDDRPYSEKVKESCEREFAGEGEIAVNDCRIRALTAELYRQRAARQQRAEDGAR